MSEVKRYYLEDGGLHIACGENLCLGSHVEVEDFDRVTTERDAALDSLRIERGVLGVANETIASLAEEIQSLQQRLTAADERVDQQAWALLEVVAACDLAMSAIDDDERGANFVQIIAAIKAKAALKPAEAAQ